LGTERHFILQKLKKISRVWRTQKDVLKKLSKGKRAQSGKSAKWPEFEAAILKWVERYRQNETATTTKIIRTHALKLPHDRNTEDFKGGAT
jgi:hypothetical protein